MGDLDNASSSNGRIMALDDEKTKLRGERGRLHSRLESSELENDSLLRELMSQRRRHSPYTPQSRSPSPKRSRRSDGGFCGDFGWQSIS